MERFIKELQRFWRYLPLTLTTIVFGAGVGVFGDRVKGEKIWPGLPTLISTTLILIIIIGFGFALYVMAQPRLSDSENWKQLWKKKAIWVEFVSVALATVLFGTGIGLLGDSTISDAALPGMSWFSSLIVVCFVTVAAGIFLLDWAQKQLPVHSVTKTSDPEAHKVLILPLSVPDPGFEIETNEVGDKTLFIGQKHRISITPKDIVADEEALRAREKSKNPDEKLRWNWTQILTSIKPHISELKRIHLITSIPTERNPDESGKYTDAFKELIHCYNNNIEVLATEGIDFEDYGAVYRSADFCIKQAQCADFRESDIIIDVTGGPKITSIASSVVTLHNDIKLQYTSNGGKTQEYEAVYVSRSSLG